MTTYRIPLRIKASTVAVSFKGKVAELVATQPAHDAMLDIAETIAGHARALAPTGDGSYRESITARSRPANKDRAQAIVTATDPAAAVIEWGTAGRPGQHVLGRAVEHAGYPRTGGDR